MKRLIALSMLGALGCAVPPPPPEVPSSIDYEFPHRSNGEPLRFEAKDGTRIVEESYPVSEHAIYDRFGRYLGKDVEYATRPAERQFHEWHVYQGDKEIDPLSALYIARDAAFMAAYEEERDRVKKDHARAMELYEKDVKSKQGTRNLGLGLGIAGLVGMAGAGLLFAATRDDGNGDALPLPATISGIASLGFMGLSIGGFAIRGKATRKQNEAQSEAERLAASRMSGSKFSNVPHDEEHMRKLLGPKQPKEEPRKSIYVGQEPAPGEPTSIPLPRINISKSLGPLVDGAIPNNKKLGPALIATWQPDESGSIPPQAHVDFEREFLRSQLYFRDLGETISLHQGNIVVYTDTASLEAATGKGAKVRAMSGIEVLTLALAAGRGIYVHYEGDTSFFAVLWPDQVAQMLEKATAKLK